MRLIDMDSFLEDCPELMAYEPIMEKHQAGTYFSDADIKDAWEYYAEESNGNLTENAQQIKEAMWVGYRVGRQGEQMRLDE